MKKLLSLSLCLLLYVSLLNGQNYTPVSVTGYTLDAIAENTTALATTNGALDALGEDILYSTTYANLFSKPGGIPNGGLISSGTYTYQLEPYNQANALLIKSWDTDSLSFVTPAPYASLSLLCFAVGGLCNMNVTVRFTDNSSQTFTSISVTDWYASWQTGVISLFGRAQRSNGSIICCTTDEPNMYNRELNLNADNHQKQISRIVVTNISHSLGSPRICILAVAASVGPFVGVDENTSIKAEILKVYPVPAKEKLCLEARETIHCRLTNLQGQLIREGLVEAETESVWDISGLEAGLYLLQYTEGGRQITTKLLVGL